MLTKKPCIPTLITFKKKPEDRNIICNTEGYNIEIKVVI